jgi:hypothetical protein
MSETVSLGAELCLRPSGPSQLDNPSLFLQRFIATWACCTLVQSLSISDETSHRLRANLSSMQAENKRSDKVSAAEGFAKVC